MIYAQKKQTTVVSYESLVAFGFNDIKTKALRTIRVQSGKVAGRVLSLGPTAVVQSPRNDSVSQGCLGVSEQANREHLVLLAVEQSLVGRTLDHGLWSVAAQDTLCGQEDTFGSVLEILRWGHSRMSLSPVAIAIATVQAAVVATPQATIHATVHTSP